MKASKSGGWFQMRRNWGQVWDTGLKLTRESLSFKVSTSDGKCLDLHDVAPPNWQFKQIYNVKINF